MHWAPLDPSCPVALHPSPPWAPPPHPMPLLACNLSSLSSSCSSSTTLPRSLRCPFSPLPRLQWAGPRPRQPTYPVTSLVPPQPLHLTPSLWHPCSPTPNPAARCSSPPQCRHSIPAHRWDSSCYCKTIIVFVFLMPLKPTGLTRFLIYF